MWGTLVRSLVELTEFEIVWGNYEEKLRKWRPQLNAAKKMESI